MRILCLTSSYPRHPEDISGAFVASWVHALEQAGHELKVLTWQGYREGSCVRCMQSSGHRAVRYAPGAWQRLFHGAGAPEQLAREPWLLGLLPSVIGAMMCEAWRVGRAWEPDLVVGHWLMPAGVLARLVGRLLGCPSLIVTHSGGISALDRLPTPAARWLGHRLTCGPVTCVSPQAQARLARYAAPGFSSTILPMGFEVPTCVSSPMSSGVLMLGRAVPIKGGEECIRAFAHTRAGRAGAALHIVGDGPQLEVWKRCARQHSINVHVYGVLTGRRRDEVMAQCRVSLFGSRLLVSGREEGLPVSVLECAAAGVVPMVAHIPAALPLLADPALQQLDASRHPQVWADQIDALYEHIRLPEVRTAQQVAVSDLSWGELGERWARYVERF